jgi:hypothetical protein
MKGMIVEAAGIPVELKGCSAEVLRGLHAVGYKSSTGLADICRLRVQVQEALGPLGLGASAGTGVDSPSSGDDPSPHRARFAWSPSDGLNLNRRSLTYGVGRSDTGYDLVVPDAAQDQVVVVARFLRSLIQNALLSRGAVCLHTSACEIAGHLVLLVGDKGAGKSSSLVLLCDRAGATYVANDDIYLSLSHGLYATALPKRLRLRGRTILLSPRLRHYASRKVPKAQFQEFVDAGHSETKFVLSEDDFCSVMSTGRRTGGPVGFIVFLKRVAPEEHAAARTLSLPDALAKLEAGLIDTLADEESYWRSFFDFDFRRSYATLARQLEAVSEQPTFVELPRRDGEDFDVAGLLNRIAARSAA